MRFLSPAQLRTLFVFLALLRVPQVPALARGDFDFNSFLVPPVCRATV
jgi:hypothetical protein